MDQERAEQLVAQYTDTLLRIGYTWLGDLDARNTLMGHDLRLVAHIVKKCYPKRRLGE